MARHAPLCLLIAALSGPACGLTSAQNMKNWSQPRGFASPTLSPNMKADEPPLEEQPAASGTTSADIMAEAPTEGEQPSNPLGNLYKKLRIVHRLKQAGAKLTQMTLALVASIKVMSTKVACIFIKDPDVCELTASTVSWVTVGALLLTIAGTLGVDVKPLLSLSTLAGFAISISAKKILSDTFSAAYVIWIGPFRRGDMIKVGEMGKMDGYEGEVLSVDYHFVRLKQPGGKEVMLPTHQVYGKFVEREERPAGNGYRKAAPK